jgi:hypothetical protein
VEAVKGFAHVAGFQREEDAQAAGKSQHGRRRVWRSSAARGRVARDDTSSAVPQGSTMRRAARCAGRRMELVAALATSLRRMPGRPVAGLRRIGGVCATRQ